ncbi:type IV pilin protein [Vibrio brasiliensis]|uniref:Putative fimbrial assembly protein PilE n=1 Tax=Vibrio brasiliensis LMG 20546 TaxID=945543 RepID=E8LS54_9VIBR|nr:type IV pilin protein [Vibrio brasiliensis]EGA66471.1 putative fimbrial assembly protein PilE [Vibrio brasiliensis LMG 20546]
MKWYKRTKSRPEGMTLIELLAVAAIVAIIASIAYPSYQSQILKAHRKAAISDLAKIQIELERHYQNSYLAAVNLVLVDGGCRFCQTNNRQFSFSISATDTSYIIKAQPINSQLNDRCEGSGYAILSLNQAGEYSPINCWQ